MIVRITSLIMIMQMLCLFSSTLNIAEGQVQTVKKKTLYCGDAKLTAESTLLTITSQVEPLCTKQIIKLDNTRSGISVELALEGKLERVPSIYQAPFLDAIVTEWACLKSTTTDNSYVIFSYYCSSGTTNCSGSFKEWMRVLAVDGVNLTNGFSKDGDGKKLQNLYRTLGISLKDVQNYTHKFTGVIYD